MASRVLKTKNYLISRCMIIAGGFLIACGFLSNTNHPTLLVGFNMVGKMFNAAAYAAIYMYAAELFPTVIRNSCMGISSVCARIGGIIADYVILAVRTGLSLISLFYTDASDI